MRQLDWKDSYSVGVRSLDEQHKRLLDHLNKIIVMIDSQAPTEQVSSLLTELDQYASTHFRTEEELFKKHKYLAFEQHNNEHRMYERKIAEYHAKFDSSVPKIDIEILEFLADWWTGHIQGSDKDYQKFLNNCGVF